MKLCFINPVRFLKRDVIGPSIELTKRGHEIYLLVPQQTKNQLSGTDKINFKQVYTIPSVYIPKIKYTLPSFYHEIKFLRKLIKKESIDLIHAFEYDYLTSLPPALIKKINNIPLVVSTDDFPGISFRYGSKIIDYFSKTYSFSLGKFILKTADAVLLLHTKIKKIAKLLGVDGKRIKVIPVGVDFEIFNPLVDGSEVRKEFKIKKNETLILSVTRLVPTKGIGFLMKVANEIKKKGYKFKWIIVGDGYCKNIYKKIAKKMGLDGYVIFTGFKRNTQKFYAACDIFALTSMAEGLPSVLLEAAACQKPIVSTNVGGVSDIILHNKTGFLVYNLDDSESFVKYVENLINDETLRKRMGKVAFFHVKKKFTLEKVTDAHEKLYESLI